MSVDCGCFLMYYQKVKDKFLHFPLLHLRKEKTLNGMKCKTLSYFLLSLIVILSFGACVSKSISSKNNTEISSSNKEKPYLLLISLDGFRWDYVDRFKPKNLSKFIAGGVKAASLVPSFPSKTFPNHYTIATGMYPDHHLLLGNSFYNYETKKIYSMGNPAMVTDGRYYGGSPIWVQAGKAGLTTASFFFPGTEALIQNYRPNYFKQYDGSVKNETRVAQIVDWLKQPEEKRPQFISLYFSDMDDIGHRYGPNADSILNATLQKLDSTLGTLFTQIGSLSLPVNIVIVSDHGMSEVANEKQIPVELIEDDEKYLTINSGAILSLHPKDSTKTAEIISNLKKKENHFKVYKTEETPEFEEVQTNKDWGTIQVVPEIGYYFSSQKSIASMNASTRKVSGVHGYDPTFKDMHGIFYASGPAFKKGFTLSSVKNIHIYPLMCKILGLEIPTNIDGRLQETEAVLKKK